LYANFIMIGKIIYIIYLIKDNYPCSLIDSLLVQLYWLHIIICWASFICTTYRWNYRWISLIDLPTDISMVKDVCEFLTYLTIDISFSTIFAEIRITFHFGLCCQCKIRITIDIVVAWETKSESHCRCPPWNCPDIFVSSCSCVEGIQQGLSLSSLNYNSHLCDTVVTLFVDCQW